MSGAATQTLTIVADNRVGVVADLTAALAACNVNIDNIEAVRVRNWAIIVLAVHDEAQALAALRDGAFFAYAEPVILVCLEDRPGALASVAKQLRDAACDLRSVRIVGREEPGPAGRVLVALCTEQHAEASLLLQDIIVPRRSNVIRMYQDDTRV